MADRSAKHALFEQLEVGAKALGSGGQPNWSASSPSVSAPLRISQHRCRSVSGYVIDWRSGLIEPAQRAFGALLAGPVRGRRRARSSRWHGRQLQRRGLLRWMALPGRWHGHHPGWPSSRRLGRRGPGGHQALDVAVAVGTSRHSTAAAAADVVADEEHHTLVVRSAARAGAVVTAAAVFDAGGRALRASGAVMRSAPWGSGRWGARRAATRDNRCRVGGP